MTADVAAGVPVFKTLLTIVLSCQVRQKEGGSEWVQRSQRKIFLEKDFEAG